MTIALPASSVEYLRATVSASVDLTEFPVEFALVALGAEPATWTAGTWEGAATLSAGTYLQTARALVGSTGLDPGAGKWGLWLRVSAAPETPVRYLGRVTLT